MPAYIKAISYHLPEKVFSNEDFFETFPSAFLQKDNYLRIGVKKRHIVADNLTASDLGVSAGLALFKEHGIKPEEIDFLLFCSLEFDYHSLLLAQSFKPNSIYLNPAEQPITIWAAAVMYMD